MKWFVLALLWSVAAVAEPVKVASVETGEIAGTWRGMLGPLHLVLSVVKTPNGYQGVLDSVDQGASLTIDKLIVTDGKVHLEIAQIQGGFDGAVAKDQLVGTWKQGGSQPLTFTKDKGTPVAKLPAPKMLAVPFDVVVPTPPTAFASHGKTQLVYELHITNFGTGPLTLTGIEALAGKTSLGRYEGLELLARVLRPGSSENGLAKLTIGPGLRAVVFMWLSVDAAPASLTHRITVDGGELVSTAIPVGRELAIIGPPLAGAGWLAANGPSNTSGHRRSLIPVGGRAHIAQRFAIDWVKAGADGKTLSGDPKLNKSYLAWGSHALAVGDGVVVAVKDGIPENVPGPSSRAVPITLETVGGNHVIVDIGHGHYAFYAHLQPGSLKVKLGDKVRRGQRLGLVGNSGNSTEPHLHFHLSDDNSPLASEGIPYADIPAENDHVTFPDAK